MYKFHNLKKLNICYDMATGGADGGGAGDGGAPTGDETLDTGNSEGLSLDDLEVNDEDLIDPADQTENKDNNDELDLDNLFNEDGLPEADIDPSKYEDLKQVGINTESPTFKSQINELNELGITDPQIQMNLLKKARENEQREANKTPQEIKEQLNNELLPETKKNYKALNNVAKEIWGNEPELYKAVMTDSVALNMMAKLHAYYKGTAPADVTPANTKPTQTGFDTSQAEQAYQSLMKQAYEQGKGYELREQVIKKVISKTAPQHRKAVATMLNYKY